MPAKIVAVKQEFALPSDTRVSALRDAAECKNLGLLLDKYQPWCLCMFENGQVKWDLCFQYKVENRRRRTVVNKYAQSGEAKGYWINWQSQNEATDSNKQLRPNDRFDEDLFKQFKARYDNIYPRNRLFGLQSQTRLVIGSGTKGTLEMGITLHHHYGFPYIPGSALKGLTRTYGIYKIAEILGVPNIPGEAILELKGKKRKQPTPLQILDMLLEMPLEGTPSDDEYQKQLKAMRSVFEDQLKNNPLTQSDGKAISYSLEKFLDLDEVKEFRAIFGTMGRAGEIVFYDSIPDEIKDIIIVEIMTPHFVDYFKNNELPQEDQQPKPLTYLAFKEGIVFKFWLDYRNKHKADTNLFQTAKDWLKLGLRQFGIGGKTSSGMGRF